MEQQLQLLVCTASLSLLALEMCHSDDSGIVDHDAATVFLTDPSSSNYYGCLILTLHNFSIDTQINLPQCFLLRSVTCNVCMLIVDEQKCSEFKIGPGQ